MMLLITSPAFADAIGYVDLQRVFLEYSQNDEGFKDFNKKQEETQKEFEDWQAKITQARNDGESDKEIQELIEKMESELEPKQKALYEMNIQLRQRMQQDIVASSSAAAKKYGIDVVIDKQAAIYGGFDLTEFVVRDLSYSKK